VVDNNSSEDLAKAGRLKQIRMVAKLVNQQNKRALPITAGAALGIIVVFVLVGLFAQQAQYSAIDGQLGAAAAVLQSMRGDWTVTPAVSGNRSMDVVHRAVGKKGVILVGEGAPNRVSGLLAAERKKTERVAHGVPITEFQVGSGEGQIPVSKLQSSIMKVPGSLKAPAVSDLNYRLKALQPTMQAPKGPMPKGARQPKMPRPR
jgi:hypothetical protein